MIRLPSYLERNQYGIYSFRIAIPKAVQVHFGKKGIKRSLKTSVRSGAISATRVLAGQFFQLLNELKDTQLMIKIKTTFADITATFWKDGSIKSLHVDF